MLIEIPLSAPIYAQFQIMDRIERLSLPVEVGQFKAVEQIQDAEALTHTIAEEIEVLYGSTARAIFEITYFDSITGYYLKQATEAATADEREQHLGVVLQYIRATIGSLYRIDPVSPYANYGALVAASLQDAKDLQLTRDQLAWWRFNILTVLTANADDLPIIPTPTPQPTSTPGPTVTPRSEYGDASLMVKQVGCAACHQFNVPFDAEPLALVGPNLGNIHEIAATRVTGQDAETYIYTSIVDPNAYIVEGYVPGVMPPYGNSLSEQEINLIVQWLLNPERN